MAGVIFGIFVISIILFLITIYSFISMQRPGMYPPKNVLKKRISIFGVGGVITFLLGMLFWWVA